MPMSADFVMAFDFGLRHIGVAIGQTVTGTASPLTTLTARDGRPDWLVIAALVHEWRPAALLVGLPLNMDDSESEMSARARRFAATLGQRARVPIHFVDERLTSHATRAAGPARAHEHAAVLIAEAWLASRQRDGGSHA